MGIDPAYFTNLFQKRDNTTGLRARMRWDGIRTSLVEQGESNIRNLTEELCLIAETISSCGEVWYGRDRMDSRSRKRCWNSFKKDIIEWVIEFAEKAQFVNKIPVSLR
uniref:Uncharacterized protein n=1 Tax=Utricularia reniformis TaxID=192314 RepID=A0A1Y0B241_9LAMI|nr:hypothetical protein AEK19_MT1239 [Utricularia reniformis]ART31451.1 hypothetical protein AEK19_MT1239 [Utricularia reniformis]